MKLEQDENHFLATSYLTNGGLSFLIEQKCDGTRITTTLTLEQVKLLQEEIEIYIRQIELQEDEYDEGSKTA